MSDPSLTNQRMSNQTLAMFQKAVNEINKRWIPGTYEHIRWHSPMLCLGIETAEERLNKVWQLVEKDNATMEQFREILAEWYIYHIRAIKLNDMGID